MTDLRNTRTTILNTGTPEAKRKEILDYFHKTFTLDERLYDPIRFLTTIHQRLNMGGVLVLTSPYTWLEEFTLRENWVGGIRKDGEPFTTLDGLKDLLTGHFQMIGTPREVEFVIRETRRKFQHTVSQMTAWERVNPIVA